MHLATSTESGRSSGPDKRVDERSTRELAHSASTGVLVLLCAVTWMLSHGYRGIFHDASLYTLQALAHSSPESLSQDVFLRLGSQDRYSIFSPLYATVSQGLGTESAAALLTLALQASLLTCAWLLARAVMSAPLALLGVSVLIAIPGDYGSDRVFTCIESFLTPRMAAEALVLGSLAAALNARTVLALVLVAVGALIHPIMASAGIAALLYLHFVIPHPRRALVLVATATLSLLVLAFALTAGIGGRFDDTWLALVKDRSPYLFLAHWTFDDWSRVSVTVATLTVGALTLPGGRGRSLCQTALVTTVGGLALTLVTCDLLHLILFTQLQPWRWQWLGTAVGALLLPQILGLRWQSGTAGRATMLLLVAAWVFGLDEFALVASAAAVLSASVAQRLTSREARFVLWGAVGMLAIAIAWRVATNLEFTDVHYLEASVPLWLRRAMSFAHDGTAPIALIALAWWLGRSDSRRPGLIVLAILATAACAVLVPLTWTSWTTPEYPRELVARFAAWRRIIPPGAEVFWPESPVSAWLLLDRPSYLSAIQTSGLVFSRDAALEMQRRADVLKPSLPPTLFLDWSSGGTGLRLSSEQLLGVCRLAAFEFLVTSADLNIAPAAFLRSNSGPASKGMRLYRCPLHPRESRTSRDFLIGRLPAGVYARAAAAST